MPRNAARNRLSLEALEDRFVLSSPEVVISQIYGGAGAAPNATYRRDFIELYNRGPAAVDLTGWSVQYAAPGGAAWVVTPLSGTILLNTC
jgi:predicted extracellular nuclease